MSDETQVPWWRTRSGFVLAVFLTIAGYFVVTEHRAHAIAALPYLLLLACPLMHMFHGHGGHGSHKHGDHKDDGTINSQKGDRA
jgi:hypothetical protein